MNVPTPLIDAYLDDQLDDAGVVELQAWLKTDREHLREFLRLTAIHRDLRREYVNAAARSGFADSSANDHQPTAAQARPSSRRLSIRRRATRAPWQWMGLATAACLLIGIVWSQQGAVPDARERVVISAGTAVVVRGGTTLALKIGDQVRAADVVRTSDASATVAFADGTHVMLAAGSELACQHLGGVDASKQLHLASGRVHADVAKQPLGHPLVISAPTATATVIGTAFDFSSTATAARLDVAHGRVRLVRSGDPASVEVTAGEYAVAAPGRVLVVRKHGVFPGDQPLHVGGAKGNLLLGADGKRFVMKGAQVHLNNYDSRLDATMQDVQVLADRALFDRAFTERLTQLDAMKACGINTVRIFINASIALDPNNGFHTRAEGHGGLSGYIQRLVTYADDARSRGFHVIFCATGDGSWSDDAAWARYQQFYAALLPALQDNGNVLYELVHIPNLEDQEWTRLSNRSIGMFRSLGYQGPLIVGLNHYGNWWYEPDVDAVARQDPQLVFSLGFARWVGWERTAEFLRHGADHAVILGALTREVNGDVGEIEAIAAAAAMRDLVERGLAVGVIANGWNIRDGKPPLRGNGMTDDDGARTPNSWGVGYRDQFSGRLPDWLPAVTTP
jgi:ferric-dicitrate binding protein FerR (iron transport regulator)